MISFWYLSHLVSVVVTNILNILLEIFWFGLIDLTMSFRPV